MEESGRPKQASLLESRRDFLKYTLLLPMSGGLGLLANTLSAAASGQGETPAAKALSSLPQKCPLLEKCQAITTDKLSKIETSLHSLLDQADYFSEEAIRFCLIRLCMWGPVAAYSQEILAWLGDNPQKLQEYPTLARAVGWIAEPYIFPLATSGSSREKQRSMQKVFSLLNDYRQKGFGASLDNVGDASLSEADSRAYRDYYLLLINQFVSRKKSGGLYLSLKLSALAHNLDAALENNPAGQSKRREIHQALAQMLSCASKAGGEQRVFIRIDMEEYAYKDLTLALFKQVVEENQSIARDARGRLRLGVVIQAYLRDAARDIKALAVWSRRMGLKTPIRLVKGAYLEHERKLAQQENRQSPVWDFKSSTDANYEALSAFLLLSADALVPAFATHNIRSIAHAMALCENLPGQTARPEIQMLRGMGDPIKKVVVSMGYGLREYVPAGSLARGLKYASRRFMELTSQDNALTRTMRGDFTVINRGAPLFNGENDARDGQVALAMLGRALSQSNRGPK